MYFSFSLCLTAQMILGNPSITLLTGHLIPCICHPLTRQQDHTIHQMCAFVFFYAHTHTLLSAQSIRQSVCQQWYQKVNIFSVGRDEGFPV